MTKKDYERIARAIASRPVECHANALRLLGERRAVALAIADELAGDNPRFDRARFMKACGFPEEQ